MQITTYYVSHRPGIEDLDACSVVHLINDAGFGNGDNRSWNAMRARVDAQFDADTQKRLGIAITAEQSEAPTDD